MSKSVWIPERFSGNRNREVWATKDGAVTTDAGQALHFDTLEACQAWCDLSPSVWVPTEHVFQDAA